MDINIRAASKKDFASLYAIGAHTPELKVNRLEPFMTKAEFRWSLCENPNGVFLVAEDGKKPVGFLYANMRDVDRPSRKCACLVYLTVIPSYRRHGIAHALYSEAEKRLKRNKVSYLYALANATHDPVVLFNTKHGLKKGNAFVWMDKNI